MKKYLPNKHKSSKLGAKCYKIVQSDVPCANSVVSFQVPKKTLECLVEC